MGHALVGRSHACNFPAEALELPALTRPQLETDSSRGIHDEVRARLSEGLGIYDLDLDAIRTLAPSHLLVQDQCSVCAVSPHDLEGALAGWLGSKPCLVRLAPHQLSDVWQDLASIGRALARDEAAHELRRELSFRLSDLAEMVGSIGNRPRVCCIEWLDPILLAGHWVPELVRLAGGEPVLSKTGGVSQTVDLALLRSARPDVIVVQACGFDLARTRQQWHEHPHLAESFRGWTDATGNPIRVALTDGDAYFNRPGPRLVDSAELLSEILHAPPPKGRPLGDGGGGYGLEGSGWEWSGAGTS